MKEKSRREVISLLAAGAAATAVGMLSKTAGAQEKRELAVKRRVAVAERAPRYLSLTLALSPKAPGLHEQLVKAINETLAKHGVQGKIGGIGPQAEWAQDGGWFQDVEDPWGQSGGWVRDLEGRFSRLSDVEARSLPSLVNVRDSLRKVQMKEIVRAGALKR